MKMIKDTNIGKAILEDVGQVAEMQQGTRMPEEWREMKMVMIVRITGYR